MKLPALALANLLLAAGMLAVGLPSVLADFRRLPVEATADAIMRGAAVDRRDLEAALPPLEAAARTSGAAQETLALALLETADGAHAAQRAAAAERQFRAYLAEAPGDAHGWAGLAEAELLQGRRLPALEALKMSILMAPGMPGLVLARCGMGIDLYASLDDSARGLLGQQFRLAAERSPDRLARLVRQKNAVLIARVMLVGSPDALQRFETALGRAS